MKDIKIGMELFSFKSEFLADPKKTLKKIRELGYTGVEFPIFMLNDTENPEKRIPAEKVRAMLREEDLECYGLLVLWVDVQPDRLSETIKYCKDIGSPFITIAAVPENKVTNLEEAMAAIDYMKEILKKTSEQGVPIGYHNHDTDFLNVIEGKTFFEHIFDNTPKDFIMLLDTGNAHAGGADSMELLRKYPHRSPFFHLKGFSKEKRYDAYVGDDDYDLNALIPLAVEEGDARIFNIEYVARDYIDGFERAKASLDAVKKALENI